MFKDVYPLKLFELTFGISQKKLIFLGKKIGSNPQNLIFKLKRIQNSFIKQKFDLEFLNKIQLIIYKRLNFFWNIKLYRGIRHKFGLPSRGQRTHTNGKTKRKFKI